MRRSFHHRPNLNDLPVELIAEVASYLDLKDILSLQQTNSKLHNSINVLALAKAYSARHFHIYQPQSGRFDDLTEDELQKWIQKRVHFDRIWEAQTLQPRFRTLPEPPARQISSKLLPGGRWLLAGCLMGYVCYCDLDSKILEWKALIEPSGAIEGSGQHISRLETYADLNTSGLDFNLALRTTDRRRTSVEWLHIWQVKVKDGNSLIANFLASVQTPSNEGPSKTLAIGRHVVVRTRDLLHNDKTVIEIYWWKRCSSSLFLRSRFLAHLSTAAIYLIGDDRILCADAEGVNLYDIPEPELIDLKKNLEPHDDDIPSLKPTWSYSPPSPRGLHFSPLYYDGTTYRITTCTKRCILGFSIPAIKGTDPLAVQLLTLDRLRYPCIPGLYKALVLDKVIDNGYRIGYQNVWESNGDESSATLYPTDELKGTPFTNHLKPAFDEESGRLLYWLVDGAATMDKVVILDFLCK